MNVKQLAAHLVDLTLQGHGDREIVAYIQTEGEPLEVTDVYYDEEMEEITLDLNY